MVVATDVLDPYYRAEVLADSISDAGDRLTSIAVTYPHAVHKDMLRHRAHSRVVESFRARPTELLLDALDAGGAFAPDVFAARIKGMGQGSALECEEQILAQRLWDHHIEVSLNVARHMMKLGIAKQQINFILQDLCPLVEIITATDWSNFRALRLDVDESGSPRARPEVFKTAKAICGALDDSTPFKLPRSYWHIPLVEFAESVEIVDAGGWDLAAKISAGRCARVSYDKHRDPEPWERSVDRAEKLISSGHMSPFEQCARPFSTAEKNARAQIRDLIATQTFLTDLDRHHLTEQTYYLGNLRGWHQLRKDIEHEHDYGLLQARS